MLRQIKRIGFLSLFAVLAACGGGGGGSSTPTAGTLSIAQTQASADDLVSDANAAVASIAKARKSQSLPINSPFGAAPSTLMAALPGGATFTETFSCSEIGIGGSGTVSITGTTNDSTGNPVSASMRITACVVNDGTNSTTLNGTVSMRWDRYVSDTNFTFTTSYNLSYAVVGPSINESGTLNNSETCTINGSSITCQLVVDGIRVDESITLTTTGTVTTVSNATIVIRGTAAAGDVTIVFNNWVYDSATGHATSGTVTATDSRGNQAIITATGTGYTVQITANGATNVYTVTF